MRAWKANWTTGQILMQAAGYAVHDGLSSHHAVLKAAETNEQYDAATARLAPYTNLDPRTAFDGAITACIERGELWPT